MSPGIQTGEKKREVEGKVTVAQLLCMHLKQTTDSVDREGSEWLEKIPGERGKCYLDLLVCLCQGFQNGTYASDKAHIEAINEDAAITEATEDRFSLASGVIAVEDLSDILR
ncbi:uncharacterized protein MONOS_6902 [Monocercomonoides exilis]|uniref:uncharacterized protein n=1 Tax=Monocercomonoides exilis TaxID=2049356 RepID=UPI00355A0149|nr:hypothetical protein MONOS_6902 [Monocercomonoides exilis]|eukprot:MONOS_6902.1-p1 / transcript=MONOS_6902.1 / gene=MONOS_6902 / organism=Monocercomonoides_exilis_PA203 / gene_product=unspecified product / transcript_product=unspecified product / location=Mono_scaffold00226:37136-37529(+) / protein_length=112 / sequence_SO=supercontig / SO=protein_coding / is_pseudo=false